MTTHRRLGKILLICGAFLGAPGSQPVSAQERTPEQEVLAFMIRGYGRDAVVSDSAWGIPCERFRYGCRLPAGVPADAWAEYLRVSRGPSLLRDALPPDLEVTFQSEHPDDASLPCGNRKKVLTLSRPGMSADGTVAVVWWAQLIRIDHLGRCGASRGGTLLLRKSADGTWQVDRPLHAFMS